MQTWTIIVDTFREARDKKLFWVLLIISTVVAAAMACIGFDENGWSFFLGALTIEDDVVYAGSPAARQFMATLVSDLLVGLYIGWVGVIICLLGTAGMFPSMLEPGTIEVLLSKPISRFKIFMSKYVGSLAFVLVQSAYFVVLTLLVLRWQTGVWLWAYLWAIPLLVLLFSYIYCVCVLAAILTRSTLTALICALAFWFFLSGISAMEDVYVYFTQTHQRAYRQEKVEADLSWGQRTKFGRIAYVLRTVLPKTDEVNAILRREMGAASTDSVVEKLFADLPIKPEGEMVRVESKRLERISAPRSIGTSLGFEAVVLVIAWWRFRRKDF